MTRVPPAPTPEHDLTHEEFEQIYGQFRSLTPDQARDLFEAAPFKWWICGGWSLEIGSSQRRAHDDLEVGIARESLPLVREWLAEYHLWTIHDGGLKFLWADSIVADDDEQLWVRRDAFSPWLMDLMLTPVEGATWFYKRDRRLSRPLTEAVVPGGDGIPRQAPEIGLLFKARRRAPRDEEDFAAVVPVLSPEARAWLRDAIALTEPADNPWLARL